MNAEIETGIRAFLIAKLAAVEHILDAGPPQLAVTAATVGGVKASLHTNTGTDPLPDSIAYIVIQAKAKHEVGPLYMGACTILVSTPAKVDGFTPAKHDAFSKAVRDAIFAPANQADLSSAVQTAASFTTHGHFFEEQEEGTAEDRWQAKINFKLALHEVAA